MIATEDTTRSGLATSREPVGPRTAGSKGSTGDTALMDSVVIVIIAWAILAMLMLSLRSHNI